MSDKSFPSGKPYVYAFSSGRLVLLVCVVLALMAFSLMLGIRIERYQGASSSVAVRKAAIRPPVQMPAEPPKAVAETEAPIPANVASETETTPPAPAATTAETAEPSKALPSPEPAAPGKTPTEAAVPAPAKVAPKQETPAAPQKPIATPAKPEAKPTSAAQPAAAPALPVAQPKPKASEPIHQPKPAAEVAPPAAPVKKPEPLASSQKETSKSRFAVQISASQDKSIANSQADQLKKKGFTAYIEEIDVAGKGRFYRVLVGPFRTEAEAGQIRGQIAKDSSFAECYVRSVP